MQPEEGGWAASLSAEVVLYPDAAAVAADATVANQHEAGDEHAVLITVKMRDCVSAGDEESPPASVFITSRIGTVGGEHPGTVDYLRYVQAAAHPCLVARPLVEAMREAGCMLLLVRRMHMMPADFAAIEEVATCTPPHTVADSLSHPDAFFTVVFLPVHQGGP